MTPEELDDAVAQEAATTAEAARDSESLDEDNLLKPKFVRKVLDALEAGDTARVYELVEPLHPADIADLFELTEQDERLPLARAIQDLMSVEVIAELKTMSARL